MSIKIEYRGCEFEFDHVPSDEELEARYQAATSGADDHEESESGDGDREAGAREVPLSPIQRWFFDREFGNPDHWNQGVVLRVAEAIDGEKLEAVWSELVDRHGALRLRFERTSEGWRQYRTAERPDETFESVDLRDVEEAEQSERIADEIDRQHRRLDLEQGPIGKLVHVRCGEHRDDRIVVVIHHLAVDPMSWRILVGELQQGLEQLEEQGEIRWPKPGSSYREWTEALVDYGTQLTRSDVEYWLSSDTDGAAGELPVDTEEVPEQTFFAEKTTRVMTERLAADETERLRERTEGSEVGLEDLVLVALGRVLAQWTGRDRTWIEREDHGRRQGLVEAALDLWGTVGWFMNKYPLLLEGDGEPADLLTTLRRQYRRLPEHGLPYGVARYGMAGEELQRELQRVPDPQLLFAYIGEIDDGETASWLQLEDDAAGRQLGPENARTHRLEVLASVTGGELMVRWNFSDAAYRRATIERLAAELSRNIREVSAEFEQG